MPLAEKLYRQYVFWRDQHIWFPDRADWGRLSLYFLSFVYNIYGNTPADKKKITIASFLKWAAYEIYFMWYAICDILQS